jgi:hypothetical protein
MTPAAQTWKVGEVPMMTRQRAARTLPPAMSRAAPMRSIIRPAHGAAKPPMRRPTEKTA